MFAKINWEELHRKHEARRDCFRWLCLVFDRLLAENNLQAAQDCLMAMGITRQEMNRG